MPSDSPAFGISRPASSSLRLRRSVHPRPTRAFSFLATVTILSSSLSHLGRRSRRAWCDALSPQRPSVTMSASASASASASTPSPALSSFFSRFDNSWTEQLTPNLEVNDPSADNKMRPVRHGHYVAVDPRPLTEPRLLLHSPEMVAALGISEEEVGSPAFLRFFSGDVRAAGSPGRIAAWATPYALSIMGTPYTS
eukprot:CAMPEP_0113320864 /NCGR_PEP_ID=MMETSP0010_2-20120614/14540_1 /TAXON_ID=216773 ORGANISM="Corethron hystrix, Strain 308" /NCGR_SAMPLE_ID=MMETSP0010_2 /ASSEMBLY_ACC=CAM_ASM_000155 /LENGTH=195 /DNA_ID=CAMNT_0000178807 /DNA_START=50 /DNA_END=634 /DNA_ORIENTATION=+ /assembly_acc=CAM_ASM_000155